MRQISQGAEAKLFRDGDALIKSRIKKSYRIPEIDDVLRKTRTRKEAKLLLKLQNLKINVPKLIDSSDKKMEIKMQFVDGHRISEVLDSKNYKMICSEIGRIVAVLHQNNIIHGDLTTSNFIISGKKIYVIDFGLSFTSTKIEDKAVDIHLLKQALESKHYAIHSMAFSEFVKSYKKEEMEAKEILKRLELVESRGRYKH